MRQGLLLFEACCNIGSETQKVQMVAKTMVATFRKGNERCFTCGDKTHLKRDCPKKAKNKQTNKQTNKQPKNTFQKICPHCCREMHWAKECKSKFDIEGKPIPENSKQETPQVPFNKKQGQIPSFPSNPQHPAVLLNDFLLCPQAIPSRIPTRLFGSLPSQTFGLLLGRSSLT